MIITEGIELKDDMRWSSRDVKSDLKYFGYNILDRSKMTNDDLHFFAWLCRRALKEIEKYEMYYVR